MNAPARSKGALALKVAGALAALAALLLIGRHLGGYVPAFGRWVAGLGALGPAVFVLGYALATIAFLPGSLLTLAGGAIFGLAWGTVWVFAGAMLGSSLAFLIARYVARAAIGRRVAGNRKFAAIDRAVGTHGFKIVCLLRLSPVFPYNLLNYALGLTRVRFVHFLLADIGMLPGTLLYVYYGKVAGDVAALAGGAAPQRTAWDHALLGLGLAATVAVTLIITRLARRALAEAADV
jgi:uncharacterized membrane protein YdjX (TVP38/TMEM64 family)